MGVLVLRLMFLGLRLVPRSATATILTPPIFSMRTSLLRFNFLAIISKAHSNILVLLNDLCNPDASLRINERVSAVQV